MKYHPDKHTLIMGLHALEELLQRSPERFISVFTLQTSNKTGGRKLKLLERLKKQGVQIHTVGIKELTRLASSDSHQGFVAVLRKRPNINLSQFFKESKKRSLVLALDSITDPHNVGAILRAAECFGVNLVMWSKNRGAPLNATVAKTSSSASEIVPILIVSNLSQSLEQFVENDYEVVIADVGEKSHNLFEIELPKKTLLVLGSEGEGVRSVIRKKAQHAYKIPMCGQIDSLNVSQAAAVFLSFWSAQSY